MRDPLDIISYCGFIGTKSFYRYNSNNPNKDYSYMNLQRANLQEANLQEADLQEANLQRANLQGADLQRANLQGADLQRANLQGVDLQGAYLQEADLQEADLQGANLQRANLQGADLQRANLQGVDLQGVDLQGVDLSIKLYNLKNAIKIGNDLFKMWKKVGKIKTEEFYGSITNKDSRAIILPSTDLPLQFCFVFERKELWIYNWICPDPKTVLILKKWK